MCASRQPYAAAGHPAPDTRTERLDASTVAQPCALFNARHGHISTLWEGRQKACLVDDDNYLLTCTRYIELNPVRAGMVADPVDYPWSSYHANGYGVDLHFLQPHSSWSAIDRGPAQRHQLWRELVMEGATTDAPDPLRLCLQRQQPYGSDRFRAAIDAQLGRRCGPARVGRPPKKSQSESAL